ncbi:L-type lectin-domain containing protein [Marinoscillum furvescens]|uniref:Legume-like lectin family protein n=1 Tax=Marinoscillum furvescens DSM 4134 TaxID=1122208 RepID=A0A3D9LGK8_MARFU|nr:L-type lectin-domain containing protein [Marinoscillum furvescens]REE05594.1 legume-like lectin family protein [Marinoscillum furvescens DSM 4134]
MRLMIFTAVLLGTYFAKAQYYFLGTAAPMQDGCIQLTPDQPYAEGLAYNHSPLDLTRFFEIQFDLYLGDKDEGADGITFVIHNDQRGYDAYGQWGECMGYGQFNPFSQGVGIAPSVAVEFDTYPNSVQNDPMCDHVAYLENGVSRHQESWFGSDSTYNIEDDYLHDFRFRWRPEDQLIQVFWDGREVVRRKRDLINDVFGGATQVIWGFTASTGRAHNFQYFCLRKFAGYVRVETDKNG